MEQGVAPKGMKEILQQGFAQKGVEVSSDQLEQFWRYGHLLEETNKVMNLTAIHGERDIAIKHFLDSSSCLWGHDIPCGSKVIDVGTGAGFPALPVKILRPDLEVLLLDSLAKRIQFLDHVVEELKLKKVRTLHSRAEDAAHNADYRQSFDYGVSRAVAPLNVLLEYMIPFLKVGGLFLCQKGPSAEEEIQAAQRALQLLNCHIVDLVEVEIPFSDFSRRMVIIEKQQETNKRYPRKAGKPSKEPL